uniref:Uncharacterized protein n=1 Tax=Plectus sambesii TaxID=2011161 RepID=A0A914XC82_9BILA
NKRKQKLVSLGKREEKAGGKRQNTTMVGARVMQTEKARAPPPNWTSERMRSETERPMQTMLFEENGEKADDCRQGCGSFAPNPLPPALRTMPSSSIAGVSVGRRPSSLGPFAQTLLFTVLFALLIQFAVPIEYDVCPEESSALIENGTEYQCSSADDALCAAPYSCDNSTSFCCGQPLNAEELQPEVDDAELLQPEVDDAEELHPEVDEAQSLLISEEDHTRYCGSEGRILRENNQNVKCTIDSDCLPPAICKEEGFCCLVTLDQEPPPVGCPLGTRSLKNSAASSTAQYSCAFGTPILTSTGQNSFCSVTNRCNAPDTCQQATGFPSVYICCRSTDTSASYTCPNSGTPEYLGAQQRTCTISNPTCGNGYFCQQSLNNPMRICCTIGGTSAQFTCPGSFGSPALNNGINVFCNTSANDPTASICCYGTSGEAVYTCPNGAQAQSGVGGLPYAICNIAAPLSQCNIGYTCSRAANNIQVAICCAGQLSSVPICPSQAVLLYESGRPKYCSQLGAACPTGYSCRETINIPGSYVCCSSGTALTCPINYAPTTDTRGNPTFCTQSNPSVCPGGSSCMQSASTPSAFICCRSTASEYVCPNNQNALVGSNGQVQVCTGPGSPCSRAGYTCQVSATFGVFVCCGRDATAATCADGRETYTQTPGVTYDCNPLQAPSRCPVNFDCALSNVAGTSVCCRRSTTSSSATCPAGWNPFLSEIDSSMRFCQGPLDVNCPVGYSCTQSSSQNVFICCRLTSTALRCYNGAAVYMVSGQTRLCSQSASNCPNGYACQESTAPNVYVCCQTQSQPNVLCVDNSLPSTIGGSPQYCSPAGSTTVCPSGFICSASTRVGFNVCCRTNIINPPSSTNACGPNAETYIVNQGPYRCSSNPDSCPALYTCQQSVIDNERYCCRNAQCPNGLTIGLAPTICSPTSNICTAGFSCQQSSNIPGVSLCCPSGTTGGGTNVGAARCLGRSTQLVGSQAVSCTIPSFGCALGFECSAYTTSGAYICCAVQVDPGTGSGTGSCPSNRDPYRDPNTRQMLYCDSTDFTCPTGYVCKREQSSSNRYVCCSPIPYCQTGWTPFIDATTQQAQRCLPSQLNQQCPSVGAAYRCQLSTVPGVHVCCQEAIGSRAIGTGADVPPEANLTTITKLPMPTATDDEDWFVFEG